MDNSIVSRIRIAGALATIVAAASAHGADPLPISLDAESSSFDRQNNTVVFRRLSIAQGDMLIRADEAVATGLDFAKGEWRFSGNVMFTVEGARIHADSATISFIDNALQTAELVGAPATFEQIAEPGEDSIGGGANRLTYDNVARIMRLLDGAWFAQGQNEFSGCDLIYDLDREHITSGSSDCGQPVVITIVPRNADGDEAGSGTP